VPKIKIELKMYKKTIDAAKNKLKAYSSYALIILSIMLAISLGRNLLRVKQAYEKIDEAEKRGEKLGRENQTLEAQIEFLGSDAHTESQLRDKLGLVKEGDIVVILPADKVLRKLAPKRVEEELTQPDPNWKKWYKLFF